MATLTVRNLSDELHRALRVRAAQHGRSTEAEVREILAAVVMPSTRIGIGDALAESSKKIGLSNKDFSIFQKVKDLTPTGPLRFK